MLGDDEDIEVVNIEPMLHNRWSVIAPGLEMISNIAGEVQSTFKVWAIFAAQHGCQRHYDNKFRRMTNGNSGIGTGTNVSED